MGAGELLVLIILLFTAGTVFTVWVRRVMARGRERLRRESELAGPPPAPSPAPVASAKAAGPEPVPAAERVVIERQVLVMRCKHCATITPVDLSACSHCGAKL